MNQMIKKLKLSFYTLVILFIATACNSSDNDVKQEFVTVSVSIEENSINLSELFESIEPILLETNDSSLIGEYPELSFTDNLIFIKTDNKIKIFDFEGRFLKSIDKKGNGSGEYMGISDFYINEQSKRIEVLDKRQKKILNYNYDGDFLDDLSLNYWGGKIIRDSQNRLYVYSGYERDEDNIYKFNVIDNDVRHSFNEIDKKKSEYLHIMNPIYFHKNYEDEILFFEPFNDTIYTLEKQSIEPKYVISYNGRNVPESFYANNEFPNVFEFFQEYNKHDYVNSTYNVIESDNNLFFTCRKGSDKYLVLHDKKSNSAHSYNRVVDDLFSDGLELPFQNDDFMFFAEKNTILFFLQPYWLIEHKDKIVSNDLKRMMKDLNEEDNPILMVGRLK